MQAMQRRAGYHLCRCLRIDCKHRKSVETLTEDLIISEAGDGYVYFSFPNGYSESTALLVKSLLLGLESIRRDYGAQYLEIAFKEV